MMPILKDQKKTDCLYPSLDAIFAIPWEEAGEAAYQPHCFQSQKIGSKSSAGTNQLCTWYLFLITINRS